VEQFIAWSCLILGFILAAVGTIAPGIPGAAFAVIGIFIHKLILPEMLTWWTFIIVVILAVVSWVVDFFAGILGAKIGGASRYGIIGAALGGFLGIFFSLPGLVIGPFVGAILGDLFAKRKDILSLLRVGSGAALGFVISILTRIVLLVAMLILVLIDAAL
jgi:uncharacterized protein